MRRRGRWPAESLQPTEVTELREALDRVTTLHLKQAVHLVQLEVSERPDLDHTLAQVVTNLADVRRRLPA